jgi:hypothetical protein
MKSSFLRAPCFNREIQGVFAEPRTEARPQSRKALFVSRLGGNLLSTETGRHFQGNRKKYRNNRTKTQPNVSRETLVPSVSASRSMSHMKHLFLAPLVQLGEFPDAAPGAGEQAPGATDGRTGFKRRRQSFTLNTVPYP